MDGFCICSLRSRFILYICQRYEPRQKSTHSSACMCSQTHMCSCMCSQTCMWARMCACLCSQTLICTHISTRMCSSTCLFSNAHICALVYASNLICVLVRALKLICPPKTLCALVSAHWNMSANKKIPHTGDKASLDRCG